MGGTDIRRLTYAQVMGWEYRDKNNPDEAFYGNVATGASFGLSGNDEMRMSSAGAMGTAAAFAAIGAGLHQTPETGTLKISLNDHANPFATVYISRADFIERLQHFWSYCKENS